MEANLAFISIVLIIFGVPFGMIIKKNRSLKKEMEKKDQQVISLKKEKNILYIDEVAHKSTIEKYEKENSKLEKENTELKFQLINFKAEAIRWRDEYTKLQ